MTQWVIKLSKLCNLRCRYCYEFKHLSDPNRISPENLNRLLENIAEHGAAVGTKQHFVWHGGEPLALPRDYFGQLFDAQSRVFERFGTDYRNSVQTNLYSINDEKIDLLRKFDSVGVSFDVFGDYRESATGRQSMQQVLENMDRLRNAGINFGCIAVLTPEVARNIERVHDFFAEIDVSYRILPIYRTAFSGQHEEWALETEDVLNAFRRLFVRMLDTDVRIISSPIAGYLKNVVSMYGGVQASRHYLADTPQDERLFIVNTDGEVFASSDAYMPGHSYGNIFNESVPELLASDGYKQTRADRLERLGACRSCSFRSACSGEYIGEATRELRQRDSSGTYVCPVARDMQRFVETVLAERGLIDRTAQAINLDPLLPFIEPTEGSAQRVSA